MKALPISPIKVPLSRSDLAQMLRLVEISWQLAQSAAYRQALSAQLPPVAQFDPKGGGVMMGYDFHLSAEGPRLIEVNTNAGGAALALRASTGHTALPTSLGRKLRRMFLGEWQSFAPVGTVLKRVVILDDDPEQQALYPEMKCFVSWLKDCGLRVDICDPGELDADENGVLLNGETIDLVYNRHCDFYLEEAALAGIRAAYLARKVCLTPNPFVYAHLADKRRLISWRQVETMRSCGLNEGQIQLLQTLVPESRLLAELEPDDAWQQRKKLVFKPVDRFGSKGVLLGKSMSRKRFADFDPQLTLVQELVPPSQVADDTGNSFKVDLRLYAWRNRALGVAARLYQGQVTNLHTEGGGFAAVELR